ncbi:hypothetical protein [Pedobacter sp. MW01-1-1]|uniref:hypothetical protein n=1 Tax=Pedobacter sp. MW01-1-1 TaxID=3383027 RepID=UPI003FEE158F
MKNNSSPLTKQKNNKLIVLSVLAICLSLMVFAHSEKPHNEEKNPAKQQIRVVNDSIQSVQAFTKVYKVLMSPRCMNCHPSGDVPLQGDDSHIHSMLPKRGSDGKGMLSMKCMNCHQPENTAGVHTPPGNPNWHLPPANMKMIFQGKTMNQLAKQLTDKSKNGNKDLKALIAHADDALVKWAWQPGTGRSLPPLSHQEFKDAWITWLKTGAYAPAK